MIPGELELWLNFRFSTEQTSAGLRNAVEQCFARHAVEVEIEWVLSGEPFITEEGALIDASRASIHAVAGIEPLLSTSGGTSDGRFIAPYGVQVLELGPVNASIHRVNEHVRVDDLGKLSAMYLGILERLFPRA
jgi:succinyl-diaminopimelate desuccinylase